MAEVNIMAQNVLSEGFAGVIHGMNQAFANVNSISMQGATAYAENTRYSYLIGKDQMSSVQALGFRTAAEAGSGAARATTGTSGVESGGGA